MLLVFGSCSNLSLQKSTSLDPESLRTRPECKIMAKAFTLWLWPHQLCLLNCSHSAPFPPSLQSSLQWVITTLTYFPEFQIFAVPSKTMPECFFRQCRIILATVSKLHLPQARSPETTFPESFVTSVPSSILSVGGTCERYEAELIHIVPPAIGRWMVDDVETLLDMRFCSDL